MDINSIVSIVVIIVILAFVLLKGSKTNKERFDQIDLSANITKLLESSSIHSIGENSVIPESLDSSGNKTLFGNFISSTSPDLTNNLTIDETNINYIKSKVINVSKDIIIDLTNLVTSNFPIKLFFYNSSSKDIKIKLNFTKNKIVYFSNLKCVSNYLTTDVNRLSLSLDSSNMIKYSLVTRNNYMSYGKYIFYSSNYTLYYGSLTSDLDNYASVPTDTLLGLNNGPFTNLNVTVSTLAPTPTPAPAPSSKNLKSILF
jgi:hypothetical protein